MKRLTVFLLIQCSLFLFFKIPFVRADDKVPTDAPGMFELQELLEEATERNPEIIVAKKKMAKLTRHHRRSRGASGSTAFI